MTAFLDYWPCFVCFALRFQIKSCPTLLVQICDTLSWRHLHEMKKLFLVCFSHDINFTSFKTKSADSDLVRMFLRSFMNTMEVHICLASGVGTVSLNSDHGNHHKKIVDGFCFSVKIFPSFFLSKIYRHIIHNTRTIYAIYFSRHEPEDKTKEKLHRHTHYFKFIVLSRSFRKTSASEIFL